MDNAAPGASVPGSQGIGDINVDAELMRAPGVPLMFSLRDPDGNHICVAEAPPAE